MRIMQRMQTLQESEKGKKKKAKNAEKSNYAGKTENAKLLGIHGILRMQKIQPLERMPTPR